jgi:hypothetical protein
MGAITTEKSAKENTQGRHYTPKSAFKAAQVSDPITAASVKIASSDSQLLKLG